jgi:hypothetical protein
MKVIQRIQQLINALEGGRKKNFCLKISYSQSALTNAIAKNSEMGEEVIKNILIAYPHVSWKWLLFGDGEAWENSGAFPTPIVSESSVSYGGANAALLAAKDAEIHEFKMENARLQGQIIVLKELLQGK